MSFTSVLAHALDGKFVIPVAGKMFKCSVDDGDKALSFCLNKGYVEVQSLSRMLDILDELDKMYGFIRVGRIDKVSVDGGRFIVYRQRIFFKSLNLLLTFCKKHGLYFELGKDFRVSINSVMNCIGELKYLERYARRFDETIDKYLTNCLIIQLNIVMKSLNMVENYTKEMKNIIKDKKGYLDRAPFLISSYSIDDHTSAIFLVQTEAMLHDRRLYSKDIENKEVLTYGYTDKNVKSDIREGVLR